MFVMRVVVFIVACVFAVPAFAQERQDQIRDAVSAAYMQGYSLGAAVQQKQDAHVIATLREKCGDPCKDDGEKK